MTDTGLMQWCLVVVIAVAGIAAVWNASDEAGDDQTWID